MTPPSPPSAPTASVPWRARNDASPSRFAASMSRTSAPPAFEAPGLPEAPRAALHGFAPASSSSPSSPSPTMASSSLESDASSSPRMAPPAFAPFVCFSPSGFKASFVGAAETGEMGGSGFGRGGGRLALSGRVAPPAFFALFDGASTSRLGERRVEPAAAASARGASIPPANGSNEVVGTEAPAGGFGSRRSARSSGSADAASGFKASFLFFSAAVSPRPRRRAASRPSPSPRTSRRLQGRVVRSGSKPATIRSGLAIGFCSPESIATHAMIFVKYATLASLSFTFALLVSCASNRSGAYPVVRCTSDTTSCRNRKGGFFSSASVSCAVRGARRAGSGATRGEEGQQTPTRTLATRSTRRSWMDADVSGTRRFKRAARVSRAPWACAPSAMCPVVAPSCASSTRRPSRDAAGAPRVVADLPRACVCRKRTR